MNIYSMILVYSMIWWVVLFMVLPIGVKTDPTPQVGTASSAPSNAKISQKLIATTLLSFPVFFLIKWAIESNIAGL